MSWRSSIMGSTSSFPLFFRQLFLSPETTCLATDLMKFSKLTILSFSYFSSKTRSWRRCAVANSVESLFGTTCLKWDLGICGKTDGGSSGRLPPRMVLYSQSKCDRHIQMSSAPWGHSTGLTLRTIGLYHCASLLCLAGQPWTHSRNTALWRQSHVVHQLLVYLCMVIRC